MKQAGRCYDGIRDPDDAITGWWDIYLMSVDGTEATPLVENLMANGVHMRSPDEERIAFQSEKDEDSEIYVVNDDGSEVIQLTDNTDRDIVANRSWAQGDGAKSGD